MKKRTIQEIKEILFQVNPKILVLDEKYINGSIKMNFRCLECGHEWRALWHSLRKGHGCSKCDLNKKAKLQFEKVKARLKEINPNIEILSNEYKTSSTKLKCKCGKCGYIWNPSWSNLIRRKKCPNCNKSVKDYTIEDIKLKLKEINPTIEILSDNYVNNLTKLRVKCLICNYEWSSTWSNLSAGSGCHNCKKCRKDYTIETIKEKLKNINPNIEILEDEYISSTTKLKCRCKIDGYIWFTKWNSLSQGFGCPECGNHRRDYTIEDIKRKIKKVNKDIDVLDEEYKGSYEKIKLKCTIHNYEWSAPVGNTLRGGGCKLCNSSRGETIVYNFLRDNDIKFEKEYSFDDLKGDYNVLRFDFAIFIENKLYCLIEYDGEYHYKSVNRNNLSKIQRYDGIKNKYCIENHIPLIRIPYWEIKNIKEILFDIFVNKNINNKFVVSTFEREREK